MRVHTFSSAPPAWLPAASTDLHLGVVLAHHEGAEAPLLVVRDGDVAKDWNAPVEDTLPVEVLQWLPEQLYVGARDRAVRLWRGHLGWCPACSHGDGDSEEKSAPRHELERRMGRVTAQPASPVTLTGWRRR